MSEEILKRLDDMQREMREMRADLTKRLDAVQGSCDANYQLLVQLQRNSTDHFEALGNVVRELKSRNGGSLRAIG